MTEATVAVLTDGEVFEITEAVYGRWAFVAWYLGKKVRAESAEADAERLAAALDGLMRDLHTGQAGYKRGSFGRDGIGCERSCRTCAAAREALRLHRELDAGGHKEEE